MDLIDLQKDPQPIDSEEMYDQPMYSYGLCISLGREELEKLVQELEMMSIKALKERKKTLRAQILKSVREAIKEIEKRLKK